MQLVTSQDMRRIEEAAAAAGLSYERMMQNAGTAVAHAADDWMGGNPGVIVVLCGPGNNGGDGLVAAGRLAELGHAVRVLAWRRPESDPLIEAVERPEIGIVRGDGQDSLAQLDSWLDGADLIIDALLGTGVSRPIEGPLARILDLAKQALSGRDGPAVIAVDLPSGMDADDGSVDRHCLAADLTVTFGFPKVGHFSWPGAAFCGHVILDGIGIPPELAARSTTRLRVATARQVVRALPDPPLDAHKGDFGRARLWAGSTAYPGAALLAAEATARAGCGLVELVTDVSLGLALAGHLREAIWRQLPDPLDDLEAAGQALLEDLDAVDALLVGPGLGRAPALGRLLEGLLDAAADRGDQGPPWVVDADGLNLLSTLEGGARRLPPGSVLTPHPGEMARLIGSDPESVNADRLGAARRAARDWGQVVVLKGALTVIAQADGQAIIAPFANPALATAGTGDILAGLITGLLAQGSTAADAALIATWIHGSAGLLAAHDLGVRGSLAGDILARLPEAISGLEARWDLDERELTRYP